MPSICRRVDDAILPQSATAKPGALQSMETLAEGLQDCPVLEKHRPTPLLVPGAADRTEAQVLKNLCGVWSERYAKSDLTARDKYLESSGWSYIGRTLIGQKPESDLHVEYSAARSELSLYTIPDNVVLHQVRIDWGIGARLLGVGSEGRSSFKTVEEASRSDRLSITPF